MRFFLAALGASIKHDPTMARRYTPTNELSPESDALVEALRPLAAALVAVIRDEAAKQANGDERPRYYDKDSAPMGPTAFLRLASQGAFPTFKVGKKIHARREDVHAWIEAQEGARPRAPRPPPMARELAPVDVNALSPAEAHELAMGRPIAPKDITTDMIHDAIMRGEGVRHRRGRRRNGPATPSGGATR